MARSRKAERLVSDGSLEEIKAYLAKQRRYDEKAQSKKHAKYWDLYVEHCEQQGLPIQPRRVRRGLGVRRAAAE